MQSVCVSTRLFFAGHVVMSLAACCHISVMHHLGPIGHDVTAPCCPLSGPQTPGLSFSVVNRQSASPDVCRGEHRCFEAAIK